MNTCISCRWFEGRTSFCRKNAPVPVSENDRNGSRTIARYPVILRPSEDYCGAWEPKSTNESTNISREVFLTEGR